jgi:class 3 adenylate cyclase
VRRLATMYFIDIVGSTALATELGDARWRELVTRFRRVVRSELKRFGGREQDTAGDGFFATFEGPARAVRCAERILDGVRTLGIEVRAGVHTGECQTIDGKLGGLGVQIGARIGALADAGQILVSQTVKDLTAGSGLRFVEVGEYELKGVPERWRIYTTADAGQE